MKNIEICGTVYEVHEAVQDFTIVHKPSSNVLAVGIDFNLELIFVQFINGSCYMYVDVPISISHMAVKANSIGKFISNEIVGKFRSQKFEQPFLTKKEHLQVS